MSEDKHFIQWANNGDICNNLCDCVQDFYKELNRIVTSDKFAAKEYADQLELCKKAVVKLGIEVTKLYYYNTYKYAPNKYEDNRN